MRTFRQRDFLINITVLVLLQGVVFSSTEGTVEVFSAAGEKFFSSAVTDNNGQLTLPLFSMLNPGIYFLSLYSNGARLTEKLAVK